MYVGIEQQQSDQLLPALDKNSSTAIFAASTDPGPVVSRPQLYGPTSCVIVGRATHGDQRFESISLMLDSHTHLARAGEGAAIPSETIGGGAN